MTSDEQRPGGHEERLARMASAARLDEVKALMARQPTGPWLFRIAGALGLAGAIVLVVPFGSTAAAVAVGGGLILAGVAVFIVDNRIEIRRSSANNARITRLLDRDDKTSPAQPPPGHDS